jgi:hypothetical protein
MNTDSAGKIKRGGAANEFTSRLRNGGVAFNEGAS